MAFVNPDGQIVLVLANPGSSTELSLVVQGRYAQVHIPAESLTTVAFALE